MFPKLLPMFFIAPLIEWLPNLLTIDNSGASASEAFRIAEAVFLGVVLGTLSQAIIVSGVFQYLRNEPLSLQRPVELVIRRSGSVLALGILVAVILIIGLILLVVPAVIFVTVLFAAIPAWQIERLGPIESIKRSARLTKGYRWKIFALVLITSGLQILVDEGLQWLHSWSEGATETIVSMMVWNTIWGLFDAIVAAVTYFELRAIKDGVKIGDIAAVFD